MNNISIKCEISLYFTVIVENTNPRPIANNKVGSNTRGRKKNELENEISKKDSPRNKIIKFMSILMKLENITDNGIMILGKYTFFPSLATFISKC